LIIDSHAHLDFAEFDANRNSLIAQSLQIGVQKIIIPGVQSKNWQRIYNLVQNHACLYAAYGVHPYYCDNSYANLVSYLKSAKCCALGEIGLDYRCKQERHKQQQTFTHQLKIAKQLNLPVILHVVKAHADVIALLKQEKLSKSGIIHAFSGSLEQAKEYLKLGFCLGFGGAATYAKAHKLREVLAKLPLTNIVLETDSPALSPSFAANKPNSPLNLPQICTILADVIGISSQKLAQITSQNCQRILDI